MNALTRLMSMSRADRRLLGRALATNIRARVALHFLSMDRLRRWATGPAIEPGAGDVEQIVWACRATARRMPFATCLSSALALQHLLARSGHGSELHIGVADDAREFQAHAWLEREGRILIGEQDNDRYSRLTSWMAIAGAPRRRDSGQRDGS